MKVGGANTLKSWTGPEGIEHDPKLQKRLVGERGFEPPTPGPELGCPEPISLVLNHLSVLLDAIAKRRERTPYVSAIERASEHFEQQLMIEWFCEELDCTLFHSLSPCLGIVIRRNKDDGNLAFLLF